MLCCFCKERKAYVHLSQHVGEEPTEANLVAKIDLCNECAEKHRVNDPKGFSMEDLIALAKKACDE